MCNSIRIFYGSATKNCPNCVEECETHCCNCMFYEESEDVDEIGLCINENHVRATKAFFYDCANWTCVECGHHFDRCYEREECYV